MTQHLTFRRFCPSGCTRPLFSAITNRLSIAHFELIFVLDTSWSMALVWSQLSKSVNRFIKHHGSNGLRVTVIQYARHVSVASSWLSDYVPLNEDFSYPHLDQSRDDIFLAFSSVKDHIQRMRESSPHNCQFCICYIADGGDTESGSRLLNRLSEMKTDSSFTKNISFTSVACGPWFPTNISLTLRTLFHDVDIVNIPLLTSVSVEPCDFEARFAEIVPHLLSNSMQIIDVSLPVKISPWSNTTVSCVSNGSWFFLDTPADIPILLDNVSVPLSDAENIMDDLNAIGRQWVRHLQTLASDTKDVREDAGKALAQFQELYAGVKEQFQPETPLAREPSTSSTGNLFKRRLQRKRERRVHTNIRTIINEMESLASSHLKHLTDEQLALRLSIGTKESKYLQRAIRWKGALTVREFLQAKKNFAKLHSKQLEKLKACQGKDPFCSNVSLESNVDILTEKTFLENLRDPLISSQFMLIECFPVVGIGLKTYVSEGTTINPWLIRVDSVSRVISCVDTASIYAMIEENAVAKISTGGNEYEEVSAVCPLLVPETAGAMAPILLSKLYQIVMTFQVTRNMDTVHKSASFALLAALLTYLVQQEKSEWRDNLLETVTFTSNKLLEESNASKKSSPKRKMTFVELLGTKPNMALITGHPDLELQCESMSKALYAFALLIGSKTTDNFTRLLIWERIVAEFVGRAIQADHHERSFSRWFELSNVEIEDRNLLYEVLANQNASEDDMSRFASVSEASKVVKRFKMNSDEGKLSFSGVHLKMDAIKKGRAASHGSVTWKSLEGFESHYVGSCFTSDEEKLSSFAVHALMHRGSYERGTHEIRTWQEVKDDTMMRLVESEKKGHSKSLRAHLVRQVQACMTNFMKATHESGIVLPMTIDDIRKERKQRYGLDTTSKDLEEMRYEEETGLCRAACQNDQCWRFLLADRRFAEHLVNTSPKGGHPMIAFHRAVQRMQQESPEKIMEAIMNGRLAKWDSMGVSQMNQRLITANAYDQLLRTLAAYRRFEELKSTK